MWCAVLPTDQRIRWAAFAVQRNCSKRTRQRRGCRNTHIIIREADRLQELVNRMLRPNRRPSFEPVNIHRHARRVAYLVLARTAGRMTIIRDYDPKHPGTDRRP